MDNKTIKFNPIDKKSTKTVPSEDHFISVSGLVYHRFSKEPIGWVDLDELKRPGVMPLK